MLGKESMNTHFTSYLQEIQTYFIEERTNYFAARIKHILSPKSPHLQSKIAIVVGIENFATFLPKIIPFFAHTGVVQNHE